MNILLYIAVTLIWSSTWYMIKLQLGVVPPAWSIAYRFFIAALILLTFCLLTTATIRFTKRQHLQIALQTLLMFSGNYLLFYYGTAYLISGLVALVYAGMLIFNIIFSYLFFKKRIVAKTAWGALLGITGLIMAFWSQFSSLELSSSMIYPFLCGVLLSLLGALISSLGNMIVTVNINEKMPIVQINALGMFYASLMLAFYALCVHGAPVFDWHMAYLTSLLYLALFGSVLAFGAYILLIKNIGADKAAYSFVVIPLIAMLISTFLEEFQWTFTTVVGIMLVMCGNVLVLLKTKPKIIDNTSLPELKETYEQRTI